MVNPMDLRGRRFLVTGASSGIGRETCVLLSRLGARLVLAGRNPERLQETLATLQGQDHCAEPFDLNATHDIPPWLKNLARAGGPLDGLVHSAGVRATSPLRALTPEEVENTFRVNVGAALALAKGLRQRDVGRAPAGIVFIASVTGLVGEPAIAAYAASKGGLIAAAKSLALELARERIRVNCVAPSLVLTEMADAIRAKLTPEQFQAIEAKHPLGLGTPLDVAHAVAFLLSEASRWITGTTLVVDGGYTAH